MLLEAQGAVRRAHGALTWVRRNHFNKARVSRILSPCAPHAILRSAYCQNSDLLVAKPTYLIAVADLLVVAVT
ncbi:hypothetical protein Acr_12g0008770 [Actinidia rufa]|uniref:Uncharacterized protein n=1 Tax=Actinidia rufa TaxID=165716 RepID=A0A7J0FIR4_9ERIC|nr:hypothetical protein Acr_12g0008770 [Actinidia rufa]